MGVIGGKLGCPLPLQCHVCCHACSAAIWGPAVLSATAIRYALLPTAAVLLHSHWVALPHPCAGFTPVICNGIRASIPASLYVYAGPFWLLGMAGLSVAGCIGQWAYAPRLDEPFVGKLE